MGNQANAFQSLILFSPNVLFQPSSGRSSVALLLELEGCSLRNWALRSALWVSEIHKGILFLFCQEYYLARTVLSLKLLFQHLAYIFQH